MVLIYVATGLGVLILAALIVLIVLMLRNGARNGAAPHFSNQSNPYKDLKPNNQGPSGPNHDNMTVNLQSFNKSGSPTAKEAYGEAALSIEDIPRIDEDDRTAGIFNNNDAESVPFDRSPRRACHAVIQYEDNHRIAMYEMYETTVLIGRDPAICDIALHGSTNSKVSRCHALLRYTDNMLYISDLNSRNKTFVNNREVDGKAQITEDSTIVLADAPIQVKLVK